jgi:hypothetical protein
MNYRAMTVSAVLATGVMGFAPICRADIVASDGGIAVRDAGVAAPARGMSMAQVASKFGDPLTKVAAVGTPPISRWEYSGFVVYFERDHVIHAVVSASAPPDPSGAAAPPPAAPPAAPSAAPAPEPSPAAAPLQETPEAQAPEAQAQASVSRLTPASAAPATAAAIEAPPAAPAAAPSAPAESEAPAQP